MHHINKRFFIKNKLFYIAYFLFFITIISVITNNSYNKETEKQIEHEIEVQSDAKNIECIKNLEIQSILTQEMLAKIKENTQEEIKQNVETDKTEISKVKISEHLNTQETKRENKIYYIQDDGYRFDLPKEYQDYLWSLCKQYNVTDYYKLFIAQMYHESNFDELAISDTNDYGLMQINKCNHEWLSEKLENGDFLDPYNNMEAGVIMMSEFLQKYSDVHKALVCYNRGESTVINGTYSTLYSKCIISDMDKLIEIK